MNCPRCGAQASAICPRCDARQSPRGGAGWLITVPGGDSTARRLTRTIKAFARRTWGAQHHILTGSRWEPGEHEVYRDELPSISVFAIDRHTTVAQGALCILTDRRLAILDPLGDCLQIHLRDIRTIRARREYDPELGFTCWIALSRLDSSIHDARGDICLYCKNERQSTRLAALLREMLP
jgi:hypothetical protein